MIEQATPPAVCLSPETQAKLLHGIEVFFSGDSTEAVKENLQLLFETTVTEDYSDLDKQFKWVIVNLVKRFGRLIELLGSVLETIEDDESDNEVAEEHSTEENNARAAA